MELVYIQVRLFHIGIGLYSLGQKYVIRVYAVIGTRPYFLHIKYSFESIVLIGHRFTANKKENCRRARLRRRARRPETGEFVVGLILIAFII